MKPAKANNDPFFEVATPRSRIKIRIVTRYFSFWADRMLKYQERMEKKLRLRYIDLYSGPGFYRDKTPSIPILILRHAVNSPLVRKSLRATFNDVFKETIGILEAKVKRMQNIGSLAHPPTFHSAPVNDEVAETLESMKLAPTLLFIDPYGYEGLSLKLINSVLKGFGGDCIFFFNYARINPGIRNNLVSKHIDALFEKETADRLRRTLADRKPADRERLVMATFADALKKQFVKYVQTFRFERSNTSATSHYLVFVTKSATRYARMQQIMGGQSSNRFQGFYSFGFTANAAAKQRAFIKSKPLEKLARRLATCYEGKTFGVRELWLTDSPGKNYTPENYKRALNRLFRADRLMVEEGVQFVALKTKVTFPLLLRCPSCDEADVICNDTVGARCLSCKQTVENLEDLLEANRHRPPPRFQYAGVDGFEEYCCNDTVLELGTRDEGAFHPKFFIWR